MTEVQYKFSKCLKEWFSRYPQAPCPRPQVGSLALCLLVFKLHGVNRSGVELRGLIYKTVRRIDVKRLRTHETQEVRKHKNILIYKTVCTHVLRRFPFIDFYLPVHPPYKELYVLLRQTNYTS